MDSRASQFGLPHLQPYQLKRLLRVEGALFARDIRKPMTEVQRLRGLLIAWMAVFIPEVFPARMWQRLMVFRRRCCRAADFRCELWFRLLPLDVAAFAMYGDLDELKVHRLNYDHHKSWLRYSVLSTLALVAHRLPFPDHELVTRSTTNLEVRHGGAEEGALLALLGPGEVQAKRRTLEGWIQASERSRETPRQLLELHSTGSTALPAMFRSTLPEITNYVALRLLSWPRESPPPHEDPQFLPGIWAVPAGTVWERLREHPLMQPTIDVR